MRAHGCDEPFRRKPAGRCLDIPTEPPRHPNTYLSPSVSCLRYLPSASPSAFPHTLPKPSSPRFAPLPRQPHPLLHLPGEGKRGRGEVGMFRRDIRVSDAERGRVPCRSKEHTASTHTTQNKKPPAVGQKACGAADGNRTRVSGLGSVRSTIELQPHPFQCIASACRA